MAGTIDVVPKKGFRTPVPVDPKTGSPLWYSEAKSVDVSPIKDVKTASEVQSMQEKFQKDIALASKGKGRRKTRKASKKSRKMRKTRGRRRTQRGGLCKEGIDVDKVCNEIEAANDIKTATTLYRKAALKCHPDQGGNEEDFKTLGECYDEKKKSLEKKKQPAPPSPPQQPAAAPSPARSDETGKADLYVYFCRNGKAVKFADLTESQQGSVRGAVLHLPKTPLRIQEEGTFGIIKADVKFVNHVNHVTSQGRVVTNTVYGNEIGGDPIILELRASPKTGGRRKSRR